ncbi:unnamed protein product [Bursaphelenchus xylophilus]|uniref:(pine wood nematode) hypothetical protein n=1 Tax=Bursaphelenchus xylophilus TaxID=6326 RepID=A0A1I7RXB9_BURXY|nr:unnamed protein product [Bursaphelenchus xylophilus]CAG9121540.1 unnamed protein product [Bursaphelenchus xylophilus]
MQMSREELTRTFAIFTAAILALAFTVGCLACICAKYCCRGKSDEKKRKPLAQTQSSSYNPLIQNSKSDPISLDIDFIDSANEPTEVVSSTTKVNSLHPSPAR